MRARPTDLICATASGAGGTEAPLNWLDIIGAGWLSVPYGSAGPGTGVLYFAFLRRMQLGPARIEPSPAHPCRRG